MTVNIPAGLGPGDTFTIQIPAAPVVGVVVSTEPAGPPPDPTKASGLRQCIRAGAYLTFVLTVIEASAISIGFLNTLYQVLMGAGALFYGPIVIVYALIALFSCSLGFTAIQLELTALPSSALLEARAAEASSTACSTPVPSVQTR